MWLDLSDKSVQCVVGKSFDRKGPDEQVKSLVWGAAGTGQSDSTMFPSFGQPERSEIDRGSWRCQVFTEAVVMKRTGWAANRGVQLGVVQVEARPAKKGEVKRLRDRKETPGTPEFKVERRNADFDKSRRLCDVRAVRADSERWQEIERENVSG